MKSLLIAILCLTWGVCCGKNVEDPSIGFSVLVPDSATVDRAENDTGRIVAVVYHDTATNEAFTVHAVRSNNGGFGTTYAAVISRMLEGTSDRLGRAPSVPVRTLKYEGHDLYVAQHTGVGVNAAQTLTTIVFLEDHGTWRKVISVQIVSNGSKAPGDDYLLEKLKAVRFHPAA